MSMSQIGIGVGIITSALLVAFNAVLPATPAIQVHSLTISGGVVHQERTITADGEVFYADWRAAVIDAETGEPVPTCDGGGSWPYKVGHMVADIPLDEWVGREGECMIDDLPPRFYLRAIWLWGAEQTTATSEVYSLE